MSGVTPGRSITDLPRQSTRDSNGPASRGLANSELSEPQVDLQLPPVSSNPRFEIIEGAFEQPRTRAGERNDTAVNRSAGRNVSEISSRSPQTRTRFHTNRPRGLFSHRSNPRNEQARTVQHPSDPQVPSNQISRIHAADSATIGPVVAPIPQRLNADGSRTPLTDFGTWDVPRSAETNRSTRTATLTQDDQQTMKPPAYRVPAHQP